MTVRKVLITILVMVSIAYPLTYVVEVLNEPLPNTYTLTQLEYNEFKAMKIARIESKIKFLNKEIAKSKSYFNKRGLQEQRYALNLQLLALRG